MKYMKLLSKIGKFIWRHKVYAGLSALAITLTTRALLHSNNKNEEIINDNIEKIDYVINGVPKEEIYPAIDENGYFAKQEFYNLYISNFQKLNVIPNVINSYRFDFYGISPSFEAVKVKVVVSYVLNGKNTSQEIVENFSIIKNN